MAKSGYQSSLHINLAIYNDYFKLGFVLQSQNSFTNDQGISKAHPCVWQMLHVVLYLFYTMSTFQYDSLIFFSICIPSLHQQYFDHCIQ